MSKLNTILFYALAAAGTFFLCRSIIHGDEYIASHFHYEYCHAIKSKRVPTTKAEFLELVKFHTENGERTYADAKNACWWLPNTSDRTKARECLTTAAALCGNADAKSKMIAATVCAMLQYGLDCMDEWNYINNKLYWSQFHFENAEFYQKVADSL